MTNLCLAELPFFQGLAEGEVEKIVDCLSVAQTQYPKGAFLLHAGETVQQAGLVLSGAVHILREDFWGNRSLMTEIPAGFLFAETYAILQIPAEMSVQAVCDTTVLYLQLHRILESEDPVLIRFSHRLMQNFAKRNLTLTRKITHITGRTTREKLLSYLSLQAQEAGKAIFSIPFNRQQLADYLAVERSAMSAELSRMKKDGLLEYHKNQFHLFLHEKDVF